MESQSCSPSSQSLCEPIGDVVAAKGHIVGTDVFDAAFPFGEYLQFASWRIDQLIIASLRECKCNLSITLAVGDQEGNLDAIEHTIEIHARGFRDEFVHVLGTKHPHHMIPVVR